MCVLYVSFEIVLLYPSKNVMLVWLHVFFGCTHACVWM